MDIRGRVIIDSKTKELCKRVRPSDIAVIDHQDIDEVAAISLVQKKVKAVINLSPSITGRYPNQGPKILIAAGVLLIDLPKEQIYNKPNEGDEVLISEGIVYRGSQCIGEGNILDGETVDRLMKQSETHLAAELRSFARNTIEWADKETDVIFGRIGFPNLRTSLSGKHCLIVVRGAGYREDLSAISSYIREIRPVLIGVDGGADALVEIGYKPDMIVGDMDSITDKTMMSGAELVVHAYPDGKAPGLDRVKALNLQAHIVRSPGTSEDLAMLMAYEQDAELIVAVGTHSNMIDFLEKGRKGMSSTFLVRLKIGSKLVDAKGVSKLYKSNMNPVRLIPLVAAALIPMVAAFRFSGWLRQTVDLLYMRLQILLRLFRT